jgi:hypothetical protein
LTDDTVTLNVPEELESDAEAIETEAPGYILDEIDDDLSADEEDDFELDLTSEGPLMTDSLQLFLNEAGRYPLLTAAEEVELAKRI